MSASGTAITNTLLHIPPRDQGHWSLNLRDLAYLAISGMTPALQSITVGQWVHAPLGWTAWLVGPALFLVVITMTRPLRRVFGLFERIFLLTTNVWFALAAILLIGRLG